MKWATTDQFHEYLYGGSFEVYTDNNPLTYMLKMARLDAVGQCWVAALENYNFQLYYRIGRSNVEVDALSRIPRHRDKSEYQELDHTTVKALIGGGMTDTPLVEAYSGRVVLCPKEGAIKWNEDKQHSKVTNDEWKKQQKED